MQHTVIYLDESAAGQSSQLEKPQLEKNRLIIWQACKCHQNPA